MKAASPATIALLAGNQFYMADLYTVTLQDGTVLRYTDADGDLFAPVLGSPVQSGTAQAATSQSLTLSASADVVADAYKKKVVRITSGTGAVQERNVVTSRKNILKRSIELSYPGVWNSSFTQTANIAIAPDGSMTAELCIIPAGYWVGGIALSQLGYAVVAGVTYTLSIYAKRNGVTFNSIGVYTSLLNARTKFDLGTLGMSNIVSCTPAIVDVGDGWCRCSITLTSNITGNVNFSVYAQNYSGVTGDGIGGYYLWGAQGEAGNIATEHIHTEANPAVGVAVDLPWSRNLLTYSEDFSNPAWVANGSQTFIANAATAPDGTLTADKLVEPSVLAQPYHYQGTLTVGLQYVYSVYGKSTGEGRYLKFYGGGLGATNEAPVFNLDAGTVDVGATTAVCKSTSIEAVGNGWYRCSAVVVAAGTVGLCVGVTNNPTDNTNYTYTGNGVSGIYAWGAQLEIGSVSSPYVATTTAAILPPGATSTYDIIECQYASTSPKIVRDRTKSVVGIEVDSMNVTLYAGVQDLINGIPFPQFVANGGFDGARVQVDRCFMPSYGDTSAGVVNIFTGRVSDVKPSRTEIQLSVTSDLELLNAPMPRNVYSPACSHNLFDSGCGASKAAFSAATACATGTTNLVINCSLAQAAGHFDAGTITFNSGQNAGASRTVKSYTPGVFVLSLPLPFVPAVGDAFTAYAGCDKSQATCNSKFNRLASFRGFPFIPVPEASI